MLWPLWCGLSAGYLYYYSNALLLKDLLAEIQKFVQLASKYCNKVGQNSWPALLCLVKALQRYW